MNLLVKKKFKKTIATSTSLNRLEERGIGIKRYFISSLPVNALAPQMQIMDEDEPNFSEMENPVIDETNTTVDNTLKNENLDGLLKDIKSFKELLDSVESRLHRMEEGIIANSNVQKASLLSDNGIEASSGFAVDLLKERIVFLENKPKQKDTVIKFLTKRLVEDNCQVVGKGYNANVPLVQSNDSGESSADSKIIKNLWNGTNEQFKKRKIIIVGDSLLNGIHEKGLSKNHSVKVNNIPGGTSDAILDKLDDFLKNKPDGLIVYAGTNDITKGKNLLNNVKKILKQVKKLSPNTKVAFSSIVTRKDKKDISKTVQDTNSRLKIYCSQKNIDFIQNSNIMEEHLGVKKLHLNKKGNSLLANNFLKYLRSTFWDDIDSNCFEVNVNECESKLNLPDRLSNVVSERSLKEIRTKNLNWVVLAHLNP